ncbi:uncharacterized protein LOC118409825 [Branchiostoma floridae]|uniref:protein-tyrosine-phosphatase n=1 Tax=Branchiostoma floridae TaxID=7739 RepID=A0A9J7KNF5_BRAFL|nr:uncharacterized protein LOC118409825 [Branchiostoma floridae]
MMFSQRAAVFLITVTIGAHDLLGTWAAVQSPLFAVGRGHSRLSLNPAPRQKSKTRTGEEGDPLTDGGRPVNINPGGGSPTQGPQLPASSSSQQGQGSNNPGEGVVEGVDGNEPGHVTRARTVPVPTEESGREPTVRPPTEPGEEPGEPTGPPREPSQPPTERVETERPLIPQVTERPILVPGTELPRTQHPNIGAETEEPPLIRPTEPEPTESHVDDVRTTTSFQQVQTTSTARYTTYQQTSTEEPPSTAYLPVQSSDRTPTVRPVTEPSYQSPTVQVAPSSSKTSAWVPTLPQISLVPTVKPEKPTEKLTSRPSLSSVITSSVTTLAPTVEAERSSPPNTIPMSSTMLVTTVSHITTQSSTTRQTKPVTPLATVKPSSMPPSTVETSTIRPPTTMAPSTTVSTSAVTSRHPTSRSITQIPDPDSYIMIEMKMSWPQFCKAQKEFKNAVISVLRGKTVNDVTYSDVVLINITRICLPIRSRKTRESSITVSFFITGRDGTDPKMTEDIYFLLSKDRDVLGGIFIGKVQKVYLGPPETDVAGREGTQGSMSIGVTAAVTIAVIFCISLVLFIAIQVIRKQQNIAFKRQYYGNKSTQGLDTTDSFPLEYCSPEKSSTLSSEPSKSELAFVNEALERDGPCNLLSLSGIVKFYSNIRTIVEEFESLPMPMPKSSDIPPGTEDKNRYMNVLPVVQTRVPLLKRPGFPHSDYINANFVTGYKFQTRAYIATQAPLEQTCEDFWRMVWEQQSPAIIMLTDFEEQEVMGDEKKPKCAQYFPLDEGLHNTLMFGDYSVTTKKSCRRKGYRITTLQLKDLEFNLCREVTHYWMTSWPVFGVPRTTAHIIHLLQDVRVTVRAREVLHSKAGPVVVHCSPGSGRTGVAMAVDIGMRWMDDTGAADVLNTVYNMRHERAGAIMTKQQYAFTYKALSRYAKKLMKLEQGSETSESESDEELDWVEGTA